MAFAGVRAAKRAIDGERAYEAPTDSGNRRFLPGYLAAVGWRPTSRAGHDEGASRWPLFGRPCSYA